jgi:hypothetical protein
VKEKTVNDTLLEQYRRNPVALRLKLEAAARRERALYIKQFLVQAAVALFGTGCGPSAERPQPGQGAAKRTRPLTPRLAAD